VYVENMLAAAGNIIEEERTTWHKRAAMSLRREDSSMSRGGRGIPFSEIFVSEGRRPYLR
jgi:hypothetical protein